MSEACDILDTLPVWLGKNYIETVLRSTIHPHLTVDCIQVKHAFGKGENYGSDLYRVTVYYAISSEATLKKLIIKCMPQAEIIRHIFKKCQVFERESNFYLGLVPKLEDILKSVGQLDRWTAAAYKTERPDTIIMNDLNAEGFKMADRRGGLSFDQSAAVLTTLAKLHASSFAYYLKNPGERDGYKCTFFVEENKELISAIYQPMWTALQAEIDQWAGYERFAPKLRLTLTVDKLIEVARCDDPHETLVLTHGDPWTNNFLFCQKSDGDPIEVALIDFQEARLGSPALDLQYFYHTSPSIHVRDNQWNALFQLYYEKFIDMCTRLEVTKYLEQDFASVESFERKFATKSLFGMKAACVTLPLILATSGQVPDLDKATTTETSSGGGAGSATESELAGVHSAPLFKEVFQGMLLRFESQGHL